MGARRILREDTPSLSAHRVHHWSRVSRSIIQLGDGHEKPNSSPRQAHMARRRCMSKHLGKGRRRRTLPKIYKLKGASAVLDEHKTAAADSAVVHCFTRGASLAVSEILFFFFFLFS